MAGRDMWVSDKSPFHSGFIRTGLVYYLSMEVEVLDGDGEIWVCTVYEGSVEDCDGQYEAVEEFQYESVYIDLQTLFFDYLVF